MPEYGEFDGVNSDNAAAAGAVQAGTEQPAGDQNILREKTFNEELRHLVEKVTAHEAPGPETSDIDDVSDEELIRRLHVLFYRAIHLEHAVPPPRSLVELRRVRGRDEDSLINAIHQGLAELSYRAFALLPFNLEKRCFTPAINTGAPFSSSSAPRISTDRNPTCVEYVCATAPDGSHRSTVTGYR